MRPYVLDICMVVTQMLPFGVVLDNVVGALVGRLASLAIPAAGAKRRLLASELVALDRNLIMAAELCQTTIDRLTNGVPLSREDNAWMQQLDWDSTRVSRELMHTTQRLKGALELLDPTLAKALEVFYESKFSLLMIAGSSLHFDGLNLRVWDASEALCNLHVENLFRRLDGPDILEYVEWPYGAVVGGLGEDQAAFDETLVGLNDAADNRERAASVAGRLVVHRQALLDSSRKLSEYVRTNFDLSDIV